MTDCTIGTLKGVGEKRAEQLKRVGIETVDDLLFYLPRDYEDYSEITPAAALKHGARAAMLVRFTEEPKLFRLHGLTILSVRAQDETGNVLLKWFNQPYRRGQLGVGRMVYACGRADTGKGYALLNPRLSDRLPGLVPVYPLAKGLTQRTVRAAIAAALKDDAHRPTEPFPTEFLEAYGLCGLAAALRQAHAPDGRAQLAAARRRLAFQNMVFYLLAVALSKQERKRGFGHAFSTDGCRESFCQSLAFSLTAAQKRVMGELEADMASQNAMNRILQGDVGSGKTVAAIYALWIAVQNGMQGAFLVPTEILAKQHMQSLSAWFGDSVCLLTGGLPQRERAKALTRIANGQAKVVVGTHALLGDEVRFCSLGLIVTDEQHRFGVAQRARMEQKASRPDVLVMSATPIPRTLALLLYGDLDVSTLDELPPGRKPVKTSYIRAEKRDDMYRYVADCADRGIQSYIVCPYIEEEEAEQSRSAAAVFAELKVRFPDLPVELLHGRMNGKTRAPIMERFRKGETRVLVTTTVIEVGVDVPQAGIMAIESAERFGLATLHQLRGRVGRSGAQAYCFLLTEGTTETSLARIGAMLETNDGFAIAERDLALRGPGEFLGVRQHGEGDAALLMNTADMELLGMAQRAVGEIMVLPSLENNEVVKETLRRYARRTKDVAMN